ncbi:transmembrane protein 237A isoform X3 [Hydra vulgaris]|uniref:Transmembrane protein 237A isoform X3 n=1 Tax=Hydra vulgaris TaxID=6087 RepID=A0ABM4BD81_HYDVU
MESKKGLDEKRRKKPRNSNDSTINNDHKQAISIRNGVRSTRKRLSMNLDSQGINEVEITKHRKKVQSNINGKKGQSVSKKKKSRPISLSPDLEDSYNEDAELPDIFHIDNDDIIKARDMDPSVKILSNVIIPPSQPSQRRDIFYIEKKDGQGFAKEYKRVSKLHQLNFAEDVFEDSRKSTPLQFVLKFHQAFTSFALICHGLLAGIASSQCVFIYTLSKIDEKFILDYYHNLASPFQSVFYFLFAVCAVSVLDRYVNISNGWHQFFLGLLSKPSRAVALVVYFFSMAFSVSLAQLDDRIDLYSDIPTLWSDIGNRLETWKVINLLRVIGSVLGWIVVCVNLVDDETKETLTKAINEESAYQNSI